MIRDGRPYTNENSSIDDGLLTDLDETSIATVLDWIRKNIRASEEVLEYRTSYGMKHVLDHDIGLYLTNNQFKDAMLLSGFEPVDASELNWHYRIDFLPDLNENPNPFLIWSVANASARDTPEGDFARDMMSDRGFPQVADFTMIMNHLHFVHACDEAYRAFEKLWQEYSKGGDAR